MFFMQFKIFSIAVDHNGRKGNHKNTCKNKLFGAEHIFYFYAKLQFKQMKRKLEAVKEFHDAFGLGSKEAPEAFLGIEKLKLRFDLMAEENEEYLEAAKDNDLIEVADALGDMLYILCGTILEHGMQHKIEEVFEEIQRSNMSKLGADGKPIYREDGKVLKGPGYFKPNIKAILEN